jgi:hypothetical protein
MALRSSLSFVLSKGGAFSGRESLPSSARAILRTVPTASNRSIGLPLGDGGGGLLLAHVSFESCETILRLTYRRWGRATKCIARLRSVWWRFWLDMVLAMLELERQVTCR